MRHVLTFVLLAAAGIAQADSLWDQLDSFPENPVDQQGEDGKPKAFAGDISLGYLASTGNTETTSLNAQAVLGYQQEKWRHALLMQIIRASESGQTTAERTQVLEQSDYRFTDRDYMFLAFNYDKDRFSGYDRRTSEAVGYGRTVLDTPTQKLNLEAGAGLRQSRLTDGTSENGGIARLAGGYSWQFSDSAEFDENLAVEKGSDNTYSQSVTGVKTTLIGALSLVISYTIKHNSTVPAGLEKTDTYTTVSLEYQF